MGLLSLLFGKKRTNIQPKTSMTFSSSDEFDYYTPEYFKILDTGPNIFEIYGRPHNFPKYDDSFITNENYKLRELLLLVWWGNPKNGRKSTVTIPKYFFYSYNLNAEKLTNDFKSNGLLVDIEEKTLLTEKGQTVYDKYKALWEIHVVKQYPTNLDIDFPSWDKEQFELKLYQMELTYYKAHANHCKKLVDFFNSLNIPSTSAATAQDVHDQINYYINEGNSDLAKVNDYQEKIAILKEKAAHRLSD